jgi:hypothetical protein
MDVANLELPRLINEVMGAVRAFHASLYPPSLVPEIVIPSFPELLGERVRGLGGCVHREFLGEVYNPQSRRFGFVETELTP